MQTLYVVDNPQTLSIVSKGASFCNVGYLHKYDRFNGMRDLVAFLVAHMSSGDHDMSNN